MARRDVRLFLRCLATAFALLLLLGSVCALAAGAVIYRSGQVYTKAKVAVIDREDSVLSRILIGMAAEAEAVSSLIEAEILPEKEAMAALRRGDCAAVVALPPGFVGEVMSGAVSEGVIYLSDGAMRQAAVVESVAKFGEQLLLAGQAGVFAGESLAREAAASDLGDALDRSNSALLSEALNADERYFRVIGVGYLDTGMSTTSYYGMSWLVLLLFMLSLLFLPLFTTDANTAMLRRLSACGVGRARFMLWKLLLTGAFRLVIVLLTLLCLGDLLQVTVDGAGFLVGLASVAFVTLVGTAATLALGDGVSANVILGIGGIFLTGGLVPRQVLPAWVLEIGGLTPFGTALELMKPAFGAWDGERFAISCLLAVVYGGASLWLMGHSLRRIVRGEAAG